MSPLSDIYPFVAHPAVILNDDDLIEHVRKTAGDGIAELLTMRLKIAKPRPKLDKRIRQVYSDLDDVYRALGYICDKLDDDED